MYIFSGFEPEWPDPRAACRKRPVHLDKSPGEPTAPTADLATLRNLINIVSNEMQVTAFLLLGIAMVEG